MNPIRVAGTLAAVRGLIGLLLAAASACTPAGPGGEGEGAEPTALSIWDGLQEGNRRYREGSSLHPRQDRARRKEVASGQHPKAAVLTCSDSRVSPEIAFDQGIGDLFVIRVIGNVVCPETLASIEYAVEHLGVKLVLVLGHERCGAVEAALKGEAHEGHLNEMLRRVTVKTSGYPGTSPTPLEGAVRANVKAVVEQLRASTPILEPRVRKGEIHVVGARLGLESGLIEAVPD
ncbi:MAG: carbonic anhydrase [Planctomycetes bacterium]|nr:carbonic anhydrase [Planctomycetota bacterium]